GQISTGRCRSKSGSTTGRRSAGFAAHHEHASLANVIRRAYELLVTGANLLQSPLLLALRIYFFWQLFLTGKAKLSNIGKVIDFFTSLGVPAPSLNAYMVSSLECFGGLFLIIGLASRPLALAIVISITVAYLT